MSAYSDEVKSYVEKYQTEKGTGLIDPHEVAAWALIRGLHKPNFKTMVDAIAADIAQVFREEYRTDEQGRRYRAKHAATQKIGNRSFSLWADMDDARAPRSHFIRSFAQRRQQIVGDCVQLKTDVDVYNGKNSKADPIQIPLDFTADVEELQLLNKPLKAA
jgi:hypothetical protein